MATLKHFFFYFLCLFLPCSLLGKVDTNGTQPNSVLPEINSLRENNTQVRNWYEIKDTFFRTLCTYTEAIRVAHKKSDLLSYFFFVLYPSIPLLMSEGGTLLYLPPQETPKLNALLDGLCTKLSIPRPEVYMLDTQECYNFYTTSFTPNSALLILSRTLLEMLNEQELTVALAHELTHIQSYDALKKQIISAAQILLVSTIIIWFFIKEKIELDPKHAKYLSIIFCLVTVAIIADLLVTQDSERNADEKAIEITQEETAFLSMVHKIEHYQVKQHINDYNRFNHHIEDFSNKFPIYALMIKTVAFFYHKAQFFYLQTTSSSCALHNRKNSETADNPTANKESQVLPDGTDQSLAT